MEKDNIVLFRVKYSDITGDNNAALFLSQLEYWKPKSADGWVVKSVTDWWDELRLTKKQVMRIKAELEALGYIQTKLVLWKHSQTTSYLLKTEAVAEALESGFNVYKKTTIVPKGHGAERAPLQKGTVPKGNYPQYPKGTIHSTQRELSITENTIENTIENTLIPEINSGLFPLFDEPVFFKGDQGEKAEPPKSRKPKKEKAPPSPPKHPQFIEFRNTYLDWYKSKFGMAHTFGAKEAGQLSTLIDRLKQVTEADEPTALITFQAMLTNWDNLSKYNREKPQLNLLLSNLNSICTELKTNNDYDLDEQNWLLECDAKKGRHHADFTAYLKWYKLA